MLVLSRKPQQIIRLGEDIEIHVLGIHGQVVRLGFDAPEDIPIRRSELEKHVVEPAPRGQHAASKK